MMKRVLSCVLACMLALMLVIPAFAADANVQYNGQAGKFVLDPDSGAPLTELFPNFKNVMPGDTFTQTILVTNQHASPNKAKLYLRSLGATSETRDFLSQLRMKVELVGQSTLFDAPADQTDGLTEWVYLGLLYPGGTCELLVTLIVPVELDSRYMNQTGRITWEFAVEEMPDIVIPPTEPTEPPTEPTEPPTEPTEPPTEPTEPPTEPTEPTEPTQPTVPTQPTQPTEPTEPTKPGGHRCEQCGFGWFWILPLAGGLTYFIFFILRKRKKDEEEEE